MSFSNGLGELGLGEMGGHRITCHPREVILTLNLPRHIAGSRYSFIDPGRMKG